MFQPHKKSEVLEALGSVGLLGTHLVGCTVVGGAMGLFLDDWLGTEPWFMLIMLFLGIIAGFRNVMQTVARLQRLEKEKKNGHDFGSKG
ncbi:MAG: AtpZ/AtpI family protein [Proteobacteria bacterium]|nr:AtpZ/AtpI family protein [Pseudomonadota bacterium]MBU1612534.1 AtpZ/AtpI family protein [Pseudomonadota bacterium]